ncbi:MAG TPA: hypothetical protein DEA78_09835, partial [Cyanobacteria bacterium UBA11159]|nr:hypothetical protein [Cyanobacteria bacterium UBA11159]
KSSSTTSANSTKKTGASNQPSSNSRQVQSSTNSSTKTPQNQLSNQQRIINKPNQNSTITPTKPLNDGTQSPLVNNFYKEIPYYFASLLTARGILKSDFSDLEKYRYIYSTTDPLDKVDREFKQQLETKGFIVNEETKESNFIVYKLSKDGKDSFLHLVHKNDRTAIFIDEKSYKLEDLENKPPKIAKFYDVFKENIRDNSDLHLERIKKPDIEALHQTEVLKNLKKQTEEVEIDRLLLDTLQVTTSSTQPIEMKQLAETITTELGKGDEIFTVTKVEGYGDDNLNLYEVTQKDFKIYMILVSTPDLKKVSSQGGLPIKSDLGVRIWQKLSSQSPQLVTQGDRLMKIAILFYQKDPRE